MDGATELKEEEENSVIMKTAATVLQEMMVKLGKIPEYECISQSGPQHQAMFEYRCVALGVTATAAARSKKEAKQEAAKVMLCRLAQAGHSVPPPYGMPGRVLQQPGRGSPEAGVAGAAAGAGAAAEGGARSYVALLKELCTEYRLPCAEYSLVADTGPPHLRHFTVAARVLHHERQATATTKKAARQRAAEDLYGYLRENLARLTRDFDEEDALVRAHAKAMDRYLETREDLNRKPDLDPESLANVRACLSEASGTGEPLAAAAAAAAAMGLELQYGSLPRDGDEPLSVAQLEAAAPPLAFAGTSRAAAAITALRYLTTTLLPPAHAQTTTI